jgi:hypothetical protein
MGAVMIFALVVAILLMTLGAFAVRNDSRADAWWLGSGAALALGHLLFWQFGLMPRGRFSPVFMLFSPMVVYLAGTIFVLRYFLGSGPGWVRSFYLGVGLAALAPIFVWFVFFPILFML